MSRFRLVPRSAALLTVVTALAGCGHADNTVLGPTFSGPNKIFASYVALGNSITSGYQSAGINDSTQRQSYAFLLAQQLHTRFAYPSLAMPGCPPPFKDFTGVRIANIPNACALRNPNSVTDILNNVAVPGTTVFDPIASSTVSSNALTTLFLGGKTQVQKALDAHPTFATVWVGNNDVLAAAEAGILVPFPNVSPGLTPQALFTQNYDAMINQLTSGAPGLKGVLIGVVQVGSIPALVPGAVIAASAALQAAIDQLAGTQVQIHPDCTGSPSLVSLLPLIAQIRLFNPNTGAGHPPIIVCQKGDFPASPLVGDIFILDAQEQATLQGVVKAYDDYIKTTADRIGFAYVDPNVSLDSLRAAGKIPIAPNFASTTMTFGQYFSYDATHPSAAAHVLIANVLIDAINLKYGTTITKVPTG